VSVGENSKDGSFEEANSKLAQGLKSCRAVVQSYRSLLASEARNQAPAENDSEAVGEDFDSNSAELRNGSNGQPG